MKPYLGCAAILFVSNYLSYSEAPRMPLKSEVPPLVEKERGLNHKVLERIYTDVLPNGKTIQRKSTIRKMGAGMHYQDGERLVESQAIITPAPGGAQAVQGQMKAWFSENLNSYGAIRVQKGSEPELIMHIAGLAYTDTKTGRSLWAAELKLNCPGEIVAPNKVVYRDCFDFVSADVVYTYNVHGLEQDVIFHKRPIDPQDLSRQAQAAEPTMPLMNSADVRIELFTEFVQPPEPKTKTKALPSTQKAGPRAIPPFADTTLTFSGLRMGKGRIFNQQNPREEAVQGKTWEKIGASPDRHFLIEAAEYPRMEPLFRRLPAPQAGIRPKFETRQLASRVTGKKVERLLPQAPRKLAAGEAKPMPQAVQTASIRKGRNDGVVWDYVLNLYEPLQDFEFNGGYTYWVSGPVSLQGITKLSGGAVIKFDHAEYNPSLLFEGKIECNTSPAHSAVLTAIDDATIGDYVSWGPISGPYAGVAMCAEEPVEGDIHDLRINYAQEAFYWWGTNRFSNIQLMNCDFGMERFDAAVAPVHNLLATNVLGLFMGYGANYRVQHMTADTVSELYAMDGGSFITFTNCILQNVGDVQMARSDGDYIATDSALGNLGTHHVALTATPFQTVLGGHYYINPLSGLRGTATLEIDPKLKKDLEQSTVDPPTVYADPVEGMVSWSKTVTRQKNSLSYGYAYPVALDYIVSGLQLEGGALSLSPGVGIGVDYGSSSWGFIFNGGSLTSVGSPLEMNRIVRAHCVQEVGSGNPWARAMFYDRADEWWDEISPSEVRMRFTELGAMSEDGYTMYVGAKFENFEMSHCLIEYPVFQIAATGGGQTFGFTNNVMEWGQLVFGCGGSSSKIHQRNNLFRKMYVGLEDGDNTWTVKDNLFDNATVNDGVLTVDHDFNAYLPTPPNTVVVNGSHNLFLDQSPYGLTQIPYETGPLSRFYQPIGSFAHDSGSETDAGKLGFYHYTTAVTQEKEGNSRLDRGPHFPALDSENSLVNTDGDSYIPDIFEDLTGDGVFDPLLGETDWRVAGPNPDGFVVFTPLDPVNN